jgi:hypothetical protein
MVGVLLFAGEEGEGEEKTHPQTPPINGGE